MAIGIVLCSAPALSFAQDQTNSPSTATDETSTTVALPAVQAQNPPQLPASGLSPDEEEEIQELEEEVGDRDPTYLRTRLVFRYDYRRLRGPISIDRLRLRALYAFGPKQRLAVSFLQPLIQADTPVGNASGSGDAEVQFNANVIYRDRFRTGVGIQSTLQTSSDALLGGATTTIKPFGDFTGVLSSRVELTAAFYYKRSIHTTRGFPAKQFEPDITFNTRLLDITWFLEWDSFYDFLPDRFAQTLKPGVSRAFGPNRRWVASAYYARGINDYARLSQYGYDTGLDITWYPRKHR
jgi:hypothetical protein